jgi:hypothetical protein
VGAKREELEENGDDGVVNEGKELEDDGEAGVVEDDEVCTVERRGEEEQEEEEKGEDEEDEEGGQRAASGGCGRRSQVFRASLRFANGSEFPTAFAMSAARKSGANAGM